jgi:hypothetical protein
MARGLERDRSHRGQEEAVTLARRWIDAWQSNRLTRLLSLFDDDGSYVNTILKISACGKRELGGPFGRMLHDRRSAVEMTGAAFDGIADDLVVTCDDDWSGLTEALQQIPFGKESPTQKDAPAIVEGIDTVWIGGLALPRRQQPQRFR